MSKAQTSAVETLSRISISDTSPTLELGNRGIASNNSQVVPSSQVNLPDVTSWASWESENTPSTTVRSFLTQRVIEFK